MVVAIFLVCAAAALNVIGPEGATATSSDPCLSTPDQLFTAAMATSGGVKLIGNDNDVADQIWGGPGPDVIFGGTGNDILKGVGGNDIMCGGMGKDGINGGKGNDSLGGGGKTDLIVGGDGADKMWGGPDSQNIRYGYIADGLYGGAGADTIHADDDGATAQPDYVVGGGTGNNISADSADLDVYARLSDALQTGCPNLSAMWEGVYSTTHHLAVLNSGDPTDPDVRCKTVQGTVSNAVYPRDGDRVFDFNLQVSGVPVSYHAELMPRDWNPFPHISNNDFIEVRGMYAVDAHGEHEIHPVFRLTKTPNSTPSDFWSSPARAGSPYEIRPVPDCHADPNVDPCQGVNSRSYRYCWRQDGTACHPWVSRGATSFEPFK